MKTKHDRNRLNFLTKTKKVMERNEVRKYRKEKAETKNN